MKNFQHYKPDLSRNMDTKVICGWGKGWGGVVVVQETVPKWLKWSSVQTVCVTAVTFFMF